MITKIKSEGLGFIGGIEAMRGIAVIAVILNHFDSSLLPSGFLGVDLFFVISGFVVTKSLYGIKKANFNEYLLVFYIKRFKRIFPALFVFVILTFICLELTNELDITTLRTGALSLIAISNLYLIRISQDYFGLEHNFNLYTHTWSLGIEEQFYLLLPAFLFPFFKNKTRLIYLSLAVIIISFLIYIFSSTESIIFQYYSPLTRFWELMIGSIAYQIYEKKKTIINIKGGYAFFILIIICFFIDEYYLTITTPIICLLSALLIWSLCSQKDVLISNKYLIFVGSISYSLYLYHLPIIRLLNFPGYWRILQFLILFFVAFASVEWVEKPFRYNILENFPKKKLLSSLFITALVLSLLMISYSFTLKDVDVKGPFTRHTQEGFLDNDTNIIRGKTLTSLLEGKRNLFFVGDSHSIALTPTMEMLHEKNKFQIESLHIGGLFTPTMNSNKHGALSTRSNEIIDHIKNTGKSKDVLILTNQLMTWFSKTYADRFEDHRLLYDGRTLSQTEALEIYSQDLDKLTQLLLTKKINIIVLAPFPDFKHHPIKCYSPIGALFKLDLKFNKCTSSKLEHEQKRKNIVKVLQDLEIKNSNFFVIDPINIVSNGNYISSYKNSQPLYYDDDHINSNFNSLIYPLFMEILKNQ